MSAESWQAISAIGTIAAAVIVGVYTRETWLLRQAAEKQLEGSIAPVLLLSNNEPTSYPVLGVMRFAGDERVFRLVVYNAGKGAALNVRLTAKGVAQEGPDRPGLSPMVRRPEGYKLCPIPADTAVVVNIAEETLVGVGASTNAITLTGLRIELVYDSTSGRAYRSRLETPSTNFDDATLTEYKQLDARPVNATEQT